MRRKSGSYHSMRKGRSYAKKHSYGTKSKLTRHARKNVRRR